MKKFNINYIKTHSWTLTKVTKNIIQFEGKFMIIIIIIIIRKEFICTKCMLLIFPLHIIQIVIIKMLKNVKNI